MLNVDAFISQVLACAAREGLEAAEVFYTNSDSFSARCVKGEIASYTVSESGGLSLRGIWQGKMGYASTEALDEDAVSQLISGVKESAELTEDKDVQEIFRGSETYADVPSYSAALQNVPESDKLKLILDLEKKTLAADASIRQTGVNIVATDSVQTVLCNSYGLKLTHQANYAYAGVQAIASNKGKTASAFELEWGKEFDALNADRMAENAAKRAVWMLDAAPVVSGKYPVVFASDAMCDLLATFSGMFSAENAQKGLSLLKGKEGQKIAGDCVTLIDDPLLAGGIESCPFDAEGVAAYTKNVVENGTLTTLLHNLKTAKKAGVQSTGNASKRSYNSPVTVSHSNFYIKPGELSLPDLLKQVSDGIVITEVTGLHAGADPISGDFSLLSEGYTIKNGEKDLPVNQITVAGNFYELLKNIRLVANDLRFPGSSVGSPSVFAGEMSIAGK